MLGITQDIYEELMKKDMPFNIWAKDGDTDGEWCIYKWTRCPFVKNEIKPTETQYTNTQQAIDKLEGLKKHSETAISPYGLALTPEDRRANKTLDQAIAILKGEDNE